MTDSAHLHLNCQDITYSEAMTKLFTASWNVPRAANHMGLPANKESWDEVKRIFREYCATLDGPKRG